MGSGAPVESDHTDDTPVRLLNGAERRQTLWCTWRCQHPYTVYDATASRSRTAGDLLKGFQGYLQADAFSGYDCVFARGVTEVGVGACARKFVDAKAHAVEAAERGTHRRAVRIERRAKELDAPARPPCVKRSGALLHAFGDWLQHGSDRIAQESLATPWAMPHQWQALNSTDRR